MARILHMIRKEFRQVFRDRPMVALIFLVPVIQLLILSFAITTEVAHIKLVVADLDRSRASREMIRAFTQTDRFDLVGFTADLQRIRAEMQGWQAQMALVIPPNFGRELQRNQKPQVQVVVDGVDGNAAGVALGYTRGILTDLGMDFVADRRGGGKRPPGGLAAMEERPWYNPNLSSRQYMVPGIAVVLLTILPMMLSGIGLVREKEIGTLEQLLVTPLKKHQLLLGKLIPFLALSFIELGIVMTVAVAVFKITMNGSYPLLAFLSFLYLLTTLGLGIFISTITHSQQQAMFLAWFFMVLMIMLSGFFIPIENMPRALQNLTYLNPMRYAMAIIRDIFQKGSSLAYLLRDALPMTVFGVVIFGLSVMKFQKHVG